MIRQRSIAWAGTIALVILQSAIGQTPQELPKGFETLFNGRDLTGWRGWIAGAPKLATMDRADRERAQRDADDRMRRYALLEKPDGMTSDWLGGAVRWKPTDKQAGKHAVKLEVDDQNGGKTTQMFTLDVTIEEPPKKAGGEASEGEDPQPVASLDSGADTDPALDEDRDEYADNDRFEDAEDDRFEEQADSE